MGMASTKEERCMQLKPNVSSLQILVFTNPRVYPVCRVIRPQVKEVFIAWKVEIPHSDTNLAFRRPAQVEKGKSQSAKQRTEDSSDFHLRWFRRVAPNQKDKRRENIVGCSCDGREVEVDGEIAPSNSTRPAHKKDCSKSI